MNCSISTRIPFPTARKAVPMAAVVLPLPGPVFTIINPRRTSDIANKPSTSEGLIVLRAQSFHQPRSSTQHDMIVGDGRPRPSGWIHGVKKEDRQLQSTC